MTEQSNSMETHSSNDDIVLSANTPSDQSEREAVGVAEAALQDGEKESKTTVSLLQTVECWVYFVFEFDIQHGIILFILNSL